MTFCRLRPGGLSVEDPVQAVCGVWLVAAVQAGVDAGPEVPGERLIDGRDTVGRGADGLLHGDPGAFLAGAGGAATPPETGGAGELIQECVAFGAQGVQPAEVGPLFSFGELLTEVAEPLPVGLEGLLVEDVAEP